MKKLLIIIFGVITIFSCETDSYVRNTKCSELYNGYYPRDCKNEFCDTGMCNEYERIWKEILIEKNNLDNKYFSDYITICETEIQEWNDGLSFGVCYIIKHDWAEAYCCDDFIVWIKGGNNYYPSLNLPRETYLSKNEILIALIGGAFSSHINKISDKIYLKYGSMDEALWNLKRAANVDELCISDIDIDRETGNLTLKAYGEYVDEYNSCIFGYLDLFSGAVKINDSPCAIF